jgi:hypothetical protein
VNPDLEEGLLRYFASREQDELSRVEAVLSAMTPRERRLVREVAVMAGVRATMRVGSRETVPGDAEVVMDAISACLHMEDLYPTVARLERLTHRRSIREGRPPSDEAP